MRLLLSSDLHRDSRAAATIAEGAADVDAVVIAGDFATMRKGILDVLQELSRIETPSILVPGNNESLEELRAAVERVRWPAARVLHGTSATIDGATFFGLGGGIPVTPFGDWSWDFSDDQARTLLEHCPENAILVSHSPPKGHADRTSAGESVGSEAVRETMIEKHPRLLVCGHIHDSWGYNEMVDDTRVINAGPRATVYEL